MMSVVEKVAKVLRASEDWVRSEFIPAMRHEGLLIEEIPGFKERVKCPECGHEFEQVPIRKLDTLRSFTCPECKRSWTW
jgi:hypothetical protein